VSQVAGQPSTTETHLWWALGRTSPTAFAWRPGSVHAFLRVTFSSNNIVACILSAPTLLGRPADYFAGHEELENGPQSFYYYNDLML
jgi:hypothetical protein